MITDALGDLTSMEVISIKFPLRSRDSSTIRIVSIVSATLIVPDSPYG